MLVDEQRAAVNEQRLALAFELVDDARHGTGQQHVVRAEPAEDLAPRTRERRIQRSRLAAIRGARPPRQPVLVPTQELDRTVRRAAIGHRVLDVRVILIEHRLDRLLEIRRLVQRRRHDRDEGA